MNFKDKLKALGLDLPPAPKPAGSYQPVVFSGSIAYLSGQISKTPDGKLITGKAGLDLSLEEAQRAARITALNVLSVIDRYIGFEKFDRFLRVVGYVQASGDFYDIPQVMNSASELFTSVLGDQGVHARSAVGMASLPLNAAVELEVTLQIK